MPQPWEHFDLIAGSGAGAIAAIMLGKLRMGIDDTISAYQKLLSTVFSEKKFLRESTAYSAEKFEHELKKFIQEATGNADEKMIEKCPDEIGCKVVVYAMSAYNMNASLPCAFRTYPSSVGFMPNCRIWEAMRASTAHPDLFKPIEILDDFGIAQPYVGGGIGYSNPTAHLLREAGHIFPGRYVASVTSIGTGHMDTIGLAAPDKRISPQHILELANRTTLDSQQVAQDMAIYFSNTSNLYYRIDVGQGMQGIRPTEVEKQAEISSHTHAFMLGSDTSHRLDNLAENIYKRPAKRKITSIDIRAASSPEPLLATFNNIPPCTYFFKGRQVELTAICAYFGQPDQPQKVFVLYGLGGAGKTQTAIKATEQIAPMQVWGTIEAALIGFASSNHAGDSYTDALNWIKNQDARWLILYDNVDDSKISLQKYFPQSTRYSVLVTTRHRSFARLAKGTNASLNLSEMNPVDARQLLLETAGLSGTLSEPDIEATDQLLQSFGYLTLAIVLCGTYISRTGCSTSQYREMYIKNPYETLHGDEFNPIQVEDYHYSLYKTWDLSYAAVNERSKQLIQLIAFLHRNYISPEIFRRASVNLDVYSPLIPRDESQLAIYEEIRKILAMFSTQGAWSSSRFASAMGDLSGLSLVSFTQARNWYHVHPLVGQWVRLMSPHMARYTAALLALSIDRNPSAESCAFRREIVPHINEILGFCPFVNSSGNDSRGSFNVSPDNRILRCAAGDPINFTWQYAQAFYDAEQLNRLERLERPLHEACTLKLGEDHPNTLNCMWYLAETQGLRRDFLGAGKLLEKLLEARRRILGDDHPDTLRAICGLVSTYRNQHRIPEAESMYKQLPKRWEQSHGEADPSTLIAMRELAATHLITGRLSKAEILGVKVLEAQSVLLGEDHPETLKSMSNLALTYHQQGRLDEAQEMGTRALDFRTKALGKEHPATQRSMEDLALIFYKQGRLEEAEKLESGVLELRKRLLGPEHPETLQSMADMAAIFSQQNRLVEAEALETKILLARKRLLGKEHLQTLQTMSNLVALYHKQGRVSEGEKLGLEVLSLHQRLQGDEHPDTLECMFNLAAIYTYDRQLKKAEEYLTLVVKARRRTLGDNHEDTLTSIFYLASIHDQCQFLGDEDLQLTIDRLSLGP